MCADAYYCQKNKTNPSQKKVNNKQKTFSITEKNLQFFF
jgi:hypothetical protein